ncbi:MAG: hypothetical protein ACOX64_09075 [Candidatus Merdivicinus sp.]|jgi:hypothetical protein
MKQADTAFVPLRGMERCAIFENREFLRELQRSVLRDMLERGRIGPAEYRRSMRRIEGNNSSIPTKAPSSL